MENRQFLRLKNINPNPTTIRINARTIPKKPKTKSMSLTTTFRNRYNSARPMITNMMPKIGCSRIVSTIIVNISIDLNLNRMLSSASLLRLVFILEKCTSSAEFLAEVAIWFTKRHCKEAPALDHNRMDSNSSDFCFFPAKLLLTCILQHHWRL